MKRMTLETFFNKLMDNPDKAFVEDNVKEAYVYDTERGTVLHLTGDFQGPKEKVAYELRNAIAEQHPIIRPT